MCGIFGIYGHDEAANIAYLGLHALQHRGQESAGIAVSDAREDWRLRRHVAMGLVSENFSKETLARLPGRAAIGHVRYSTSGSSELRNAQPFAFEYAHGGLAIAHNGNLVNATEIRARLERQGSIFQTSSDSEVIVHLLAQAREGDLIDRVTAALRQVSGAYSLLMLTEGKLIAARDPHGFRPLVLGRLRDSYVFASETCCFDLIEAQFIREIDPGEVVIPVPDSGVPAAIGYSQQSGIPLEMGLIRSHYVGRTFIEPQDSIRHFGVRLKLSPVRSVVDGKRIAVIDDSLVRGTTSRKIVTMLRGAGAAEVHLRISAPPTTHSCFYGIDTPTRDELIASSHSNDEILSYIGCDSLGYLSHDGMMAAANPSASAPGEAPGNGFCSACFTGAYPVPVGAAPKAGAPAPLDAPLVPLRRLQNSAPK